MLKIGENVYANFTINDIPNKVSEKVRAVVIGHCGGGKTSLLNNLSNNNY
jgi:putative ribosome biogenesis GTPase RsgA